MKLKKICATVLAFASLVGFSACGNKIIGGQKSSDDITILTTAAVGTPTTQDDPYRKYIKDNYDLNATLIAASDFATTAQLKFSNMDDMPDIVAFENVDSFRAIFNQGVLLSDWTPYLSKMPNFSKIIATEDADRPGEDSIARLMLTEDNKLTALWTLPDPPSWSLKIREDWADEYRATTTDYVVNGQVYYPAGATATNGGKWNPNTPEDLLNFAKWIKINKNSDQSSLSCFGFSTAGEQKDFGVLGTWVPLMYGSVCQLPWGIYFNEDGSVDFGITDGTEKKMLDFISVLVKEKLIEPNWYYQNASQKTSTAGKIGIEWYVGEISETTQGYFTRNKIKDEKTGEIVNTLDWWKTYPVPKDPDSPRGGYQPSDGFLGTIITVSVKAANDKAKMEKIIKFLDDLAMTKEVDASGNIKYNRSKAYDALRWGVGVESELKFKTISSSAQVYIYTGDEGYSKKQYRSQYPGAWDWGMFFRSKDDGVVQGTTDINVTPVINKVIQHNTETASYMRKLQYGSILKLDTSTVSTLTKKMQAFEYKYVNTVYASEAEALKAYENFVEDWKKSGGIALLNEAKKQFKSYGWIA